MTCEERERGTLLAGTSSDTESVARRANRRTDMKAILPSFAFGAPAAPLQTER